MQGVCAHVTVSLTTPARHAHTQSYRSCTSGTSSFVLAAGIVLCTVDASLLNLSKVLVLPPTPPLQLLSSQRSMVISEPFPVGVSLPR